MLQKDFSLIIKVKRLNSSSKKEKKVLKKKVWNISEESFVYNIEKESHAVRCTKCYSKKLYLKNSWR